MAEGKLSAKEDRRGAPGARMDIPFLFLTLLLLTASLTAQLLTALPTASLLTRLLLTPPQLTRPLLSPTPNHI